MIKLFNYEKIKSKDFSYAVSFNDKTSDNLMFFNDFLKTINRFRLLKYDANTDKWLITEKDFDELIELNNQLYSEKEKEKSIKKKISPEKSKNVKSNMASVIKQDEKVVEDYENIGAHMKLKPYKYQQEVIKFAFDAEQCLVVSPCGSGKTPMLIGLYDECRRSGKVKGPGLIVVKASLKAQWRHEVSKFTDYKAVVLQTTAKIAAKSNRAFKKAQKAYDEAKTAADKNKANKILKEAQAAIDNDISKQFKDADIFICNYETLNDENVLRCLKDMNIEFVGADEIHFIKSDTAKRSKSLCELNNAKIKIGATATPLQRDPRDIFGLFKFINPEVFPKKTNFDALYVKWGGYGRVSGSKNERQLNAKISPFTIIKTKEEISKHLPELVVSQKYCDMDPKQQEMNNKIMEELDELHEEEKKLTGGKPIHMIKMTPELEKIETRIMMLQTFAQELACSEKLLQLSDSDAAKRYVTGKPDSKIELLLELIEEIVDSGEKVCVFSKYRKMQDIITDAINAEAKKNKLFDFKIAYVNGSISGEKRYDEVYNKFGNNDDYKVLLCSDAGAEGLNLSKCKYLIEYDLADSYAIQTQRHGRIQRADSVSDTTYVYQLIANGSYDEIAMKIVNKKANYDSMIIHGKNLEEE